MQVNVVRSSLEDVELPIALVGFTEEETKNPEEGVVKNHLSNLVELGDFKGEKNTSSLLYSKQVKSKRLMFVGLGKEAELSLETVRKVTGSITRTVRDHGIKHIGLYLSALIQAGDILLPQLKDFGGPKPTVVPVGIDQDAHLRLTRDLANKFRRQFKFISPSSTYHKILKGLDGSSKMSKRNPSSYFTLNETSKAIGKKIMCAFTGGRATVAEQKKLGGVPEICPIYEIEMCHFVKDDKEMVETYNCCKCGSLLCGEHKARTKKIVTEFVENHQRKRKKLVDTAREILGVN